MMGNWLYHPWEETQKGLQTFDALLDAALPEGDRTLADWTIPKKFQYATIQLSEN